MQQQQQPPPDVVLVPESRCGNCGYLFNALGTGDPNQAAKGPEPGSILVCINCGAIHLLDDNMQIRGFTEEEAEALCSDHEAMYELAGMVERVHLTKHSRN